MRDCSTEGLRQEIDAIDDQLIDLLRRRTALAKKIGELKDPNKPFCRPEREARILRRLYPRDVDILPKIVMIRFWREMISALTWFQKPYSIFVTESLWDIARDYYGSWIDFKVFSDPRQVLEQLIDQETERWKIGVLPYPDSGEREWWLRLSEYPSLKIIARFPFEGYGNARGPRQDALAVTHFTPEEGSGEDRTILVLQTAQTVLQEEIWALLNHADYSVEMIHPFRGEFFWIEVSGFFLEEEMTSLIGLSDKIQGWWLVGHYAVTPHMKTLAR